MPGYPPQVTEMSLIAEIQRWATAVPPYMATVVVLWVAAASALVCGLVRRRAVTPLWLPGVAFVALTSAAMWPLSTGTTRWWLRGLVLGAAGVALLVDALSARGKADEPTNKSPATPRGSRLYLSMGLLVAGVFLFYNLNGYSGARLLVWEATVTLGFGEAFAAGQSITHFALQRLLWDDGVLSAGQTSLFYGAPTYALFRTVGFSPWALRCAAAVAILLGVAVAYTVGRHFFGPVVGAATAVAFALNPCVLFYGRYGSSPAGTLLAVLLALLATWFFLEREQSALWRAAVCGAALYVATLQYSPARIIVLLLLAFIPVALACQWRQVGRRRLGGAAVIALIAVGAWRMESSFHRQGSFMQARGETFFDLVRNPEYIRGLYGRDPVPLRIRPGALSTSAKIELLGRTLQITGPQYLKVMSPCPAPPARGAAIDMDPPPLQPYYGPFGVFILWGVADSLRRWRSWPRACLLLWVVLGTGPLLLTNRVDCHRIMLFVIPLSFLGALGICQATRVTERAAVPRPLQHVLAAALALSAAYNAVQLLNYEQPPQPAASRAIAAEVASVPGPLMVGVEGMQRDLGWAYLQLLERTRQDPRRGGTLVDEHIVHGVQRPVGDLPESYVRELHRLSTTSTILLAPADYFRQVAAALQRKGTVVVERGTPEFRILRLEGGAATTGGGAIPALPTPVIKPGPTPPAPLHLRGGPGRLLSGLKPVTVAFGFRPPRVDANWDGGPIRMGGVTYEHGLGTHAWCRMTYAVPGGATAFQTIVGLADEARTCEKGAVTFEIRGDDETLLYDSGLVDRATPPQAVYVRLAGTRTITLVVTEGGNGPDCDHALWALPSFLMESRSR